MKKILFFVLVLIAGKSYSQSCGYTSVDTVFDNVVSLITATTVRITGNPGNGDVAGTSIILKYVRVGQTDTATSSAVWPNVTRNLTGLQSGTQYIYYYAFSCGSQFIAQMVGPHRFTTLSSAVVYATERSTVMPYFKADTGLLVPRKDTALYRQIGSTGGNIVFKPTDSVFYGYNGARWVPLMNSTAGLSDKVDSVTVYGDSLWYWVNGVQYGYVLPTSTNYDATVDFSVNADPNDPGTTFSPNTPGLTTKIYVSTIDGSQWTYNLTLGLYVVYRPVGWGIFGNAGTTAGTNFIGTTDNVPFEMRVFNSRSGYISSGQSGVVPVTSFGYRALESFTIGEDNVAIGRLSLNALTTGNDNVAVGEFSGNLLTTGNFNTLIGDEVANNINGSYNTHIGAFSGFHDNHFSASTATNNIGLGAFSGKYNEYLSDRLFINSIDRTDSAGDVTKSIIYGIQNATAANQSLYLNAKVYAPYLTSAKTAKQVFYNTTTGLFTYGDSTGTGGGSSGITIGTTTITSGANTKVLYNNSGVVGEYTVSGSGNVMLSASPTTTGTLTGAIANFSGLLSAAALFRTNNGTVSAPAHSFTNTTGTGLYYDGTYYGEAMNGVPVRNIFASSGSTGICQMDFTSPSTATLGDGKSYSSAVMGDTWSTSGIFEAQKAALIANSGLLGFNIGAINASGTISFWTGGSNKRMTIASTGAVQMSYYGAGTATFDVNGNITSVSDERLKTAIKPYTSGLRELLLLKPIQYKWNEKSGNETKETYAGFSAQNVKASIPFGTGENKDGYLSLQDRAIIATLVNSVQEQQKEIVKLKKEIKKLKKRK